MKSEGLKSFADILLNANISWVAIDRNHLAMIFALAISNKPEKILEIGVGSGNCSKILLAASEYNNQGKLTCVDSWQDWKGKIPPIAAELKKMGAEIITSQERDFVQNNLPTQKWDFILSDGAHGGSDKWCKDLYEMLSPNGILIAHDVTNKNFPNLAKYMTIAEEMGLHYFVFDQSSRIDERCGRGLLVAQRKV